MPPRARGGGGVADWAVLISRHVALVVACAASSAQVHRQGNSTGKPTWKAYRPPANEQQRGVFSAEWASGTQLGQMQFRPIVRMGVGPGQAQPPPPARLGARCFVGPVAGSQNTHCAYYSGPARPQCCCQKTVSSEAAKRTGSARKLVCMPSFIVIGSQKSGSTALLAHFLLHPGFVGPLRKETHYFDNVYLSDVKPNHTPKTKPKDASTYIGYFKGIDAAKPQATRRTLTAEATPAYILRMEAPLIVSALLPHTRLILIIRNPVDRAYSEYQMKYRRVVRLFEPANPNHMAPLYAQMLPCFKA